MLLIFNSVLVEVYCIDILTCLEPQMRIDSITVLNEQKNIFGSYCDAHF